MLTYLNKNFYILLIITFLISLNISFAQSGNNAFVFNGTTSQVYINDGSPANNDAIQDGFQFFNSDAANNQITIQAWIYLLGDIPADVEVPIVYRSVDGGTTFSLYLKNNQGYFTVGNSDPVVTPEFDAFGWIA